MASSSYIKIAAYIFKWKVTSSDDLPGAAKESDIFYAGADNEIAWRIKYYPSGKRTHDKDYIACDLIKVHGPDVKASGKIDVMNCDETLASHNLYENIYTEQSSLSIWRLIEKNKLNYSFTIQCELNINEKCKTFPYVKRLNDFNQVVSDIHSLLSLQKDTDVKIETEDQKELHAHKLVLSARSDYFTAMFKSDMLENKEGKFKLPDMSYESAEEMLQYIYSGNLVKWSKSLCMDLFIAGDKYKINGLKETCSQYLIANISVDISVTLLVLSDMHEDKALKDAAKKYIKEHVEGVLKTKEWKSMVQEHSHLVDELMLYVTLGR